MKCLKNQQVTNIWYIFVLHYFKELSSSVEIDI